MLARVAVGEGGYSSVLRLSWLFTTLDLEIIPQHVSATTLNIVFILPWFQLQFWGFCLTKHRGNKPHYAGHVGQRLGLNYHQYRPCPCAPARPLHGAATLTERGANGGLRNIVSWRVENLGGDGGPAFHCLYFTAMQSTQNSSGTSRKGFFLFWDWIILFGLFEFGWVFSPCWRGSFYCNGDKSQKPCSASALAYLAHCSSRQMYWSQLQVMGGKEIYGPPWLAKIVIQWPAGLIWE